MDLLTRIDSLLERLDARAGMTMCTPGKTVPCGKVCRTPKNCAKGKSGEERANRIGKEALAEHLAARQAMRKPKPVESVAEQLKTPPKRTTKQTAASAPKTVSKAPLRSDDVLVKMVDVSAIAPPKKIDKSKDTRRLADDLVKSGGVMSAPVIVVRTGPDSFRVADEPENNKLASAAFLAKEKDRRAGEMSYSYIAESDEEATDMLAQRKAVGFKAKDAIAVPGGANKLVDVSAVVEVGNGKPNQQLVDSRHRVGATAPIVLSEISPNRYRVESGHDAYASMQMAKEQNPRRAEMFNAYVMPKSRKDSLLARIDSLKERQATKRKKVFDEWKNGELNIGKSKKKVPGGKKGHKQAVAIALSEASKVDSLLMRIDSALERYDRKGQGKPCGKGWISASKECSQQGRQALAASLKGGDKDAIARVRRGKELASQRQQLRREVERDAGKKPRTLSGMEQINRSEDRLAAIQSKLEATQAKAEQLRSKKRKPDDAELEQSAQELEQLFLQSERVGNKYQSKDERDRFQSQLNAEVAAVGEVIDKQFKDEALEAVDFAQRKGAERAIAYDKARKSLPIHPPMRIPGKAGEIFARSADRRKQKPEPEAEAVTAEVVQPTPPKRAGDKARAIAAELRASNQQQIKAVSGILGASAKLANLNDRLVGEMSEAAHEDIGAKREPVSSDVSDRPLSSQPAPKREQRKGLMNRINDTLATLKEESAIQDKAIARILGASAQIAKNNDRLIGEAANMANEDLDKKALPAAKKKRKKTTSKQIDDAPQRAYKAPKTIKGVSIDSADLLISRIDALKERLSHV